MFKYLFGTNTSIGEKKQQNKKTIGSKSKPKEERFVVINEQLPSVLPTFSKLEDIQQEERFDRFLRETIKKADDIAMEEWEGGMIDPNVMSDAEYKQKLFLDNLMEKINK